MKLSLLLFVAFIISKTEGQIQIVKGRGSHDDVDCGRCKFPFAYKGKLYSSCAVSAQGTDQEFTFCATEVSGRGSQYPQPTAFQDCRDSKTGIQHFCQTEGQRNMAGWKSFNGVLYKLLDTKRSWKDHKKACRDMNAELATVPNELVNNFITKHVMKEGAYIGGLYKPILMSTRQSNFEWASQDQVPVKTHRKICYNNGCRMWAGGPRCDCSWENWASGSNGREPSNREKGSYIAIEKGAGWTADGKWNDVDENDHKHAVCQKKETQIFSQGIFLGSDTTTKAQWIELLGDDTSNNAITISIGYEWICFGVLLILLM